MKPVSDFTFDELLAISGALEDYIEMFQSAVDDPFSFRERLTGSEKRTVKKQLLAAQSALVKVTARLDID
ncbi:MAG: hypothetical protein IKM88_02330 [Lachnospiraceae bacterium]|nr:hypothetical protein [Lachnospiraceae bacterium]